MTTGELKDYFQRLLFLYTEKKTTEAEKLVDAAIILGKEDFWAAYPWAFKRNDTTLTTVASTETVDMPNDFEGICSIREHQSDNGRKLIRLNEDEYDRLIPYSADLATDTPSYYKIYYNSDDQIWRAAFYPTPNAAITLYLTYHVIEDVGTIPNKYTAGLVATIAKYLVPTWSKERRAASEEAAKEVVKLIGQDDPDVEVPSRFLDAYESIQPRNKKWYEEWN